MVGVRCQSLGFLRNDKVLISILFVILSQGCACHYYDSKTGTEHIWGFGHMMMKATAQSEGVKSIVRGNELIGFGAGWIDQRPNFILG